MNATVDIKIGVQTRKRFDDEPFRPTRAWSSNWHWTTSLDTYASLSAGMATEVFAYAANERAQGGETTTHLAIRLDNVTHPATGAGVVPLQKGHMDTAYTDLEFASAEVLQNEINTIITHLKQTAKY